MGQEPRWAMYPSWTMWYRPGMTLWYPSWHDPVVPVLALPCTATLGTPPHRRSVLVPLTPPHVLVRGSRIPLWALKGECVTLKWHLDPIWS